MEQIFFWITLQQKRKSAPLSTTQTPHTMHPTPYTPQRHPETHVLKLKLGTDPTTTVMDPPSVTNVTSTTHQHDAGAESEEGMVSAAVTPFLCLSSTRPGKRDLVYR
jgi:hypothetical protein